MNKVIIPIILSTSSFSFAQESMVWACTNAYQTFAETFQIDQQDGKFIHVQSTASTLGKSVELFMGSCSKE